MNTIKIYTDGGCRGNSTRNMNNIGAYAYIVLDSKDSTIETKSEAFNNTTNNQMELLAVIKALESIKDIYNHNIHIYSDSKYVCDAINSKWIDSWLKNNWINSKKEPVKNKELWIMLINLLNYLSSNNSNNIAFNWVKGHNNNKFNEHCDLLANSTMDDHLKNNNINNFSSFIPLLNNSLDSIFSAIKDKSSIINNSSIESNLLLKDNKQLLINELNNINISINNIINILSKE